MARIGAFRDVFRGFAPQKGKVRGTEQILLQTTVSQEVTQPIIEWKIGMKYCSRSEVSSSTPCLARPYAVGKV